MFYSNFNSPRLSYYHAALCFHYTDFTLLAPDVREPTMLTVLGKKTPLQVTEPESGAEPLMLSLFQQLSSGTKVLGLTLQHCHHSLLATREQGFCCSSQQATDSGCPGLPAPSSLSSFPKIGFLCFHLT